MVGGGVFADFWFWAGECQCGNDAELDKPGDWDITRVPVLVGDGPLYVLTISNENTCSACRKITPGRNFDGKK